MRHADRGPALHEVHWKGTVARLIAEQTGAIVSPNGTSYLYYRSGDFIGIHTDPYGLDLVVLTLLSGSVEPLFCHLHLADTPLDEIKTLAEATNGLPQGGTQFDISEVPLLFSGQRIPHHRAPRDREAKPSWCLSSTPLFFPCAPTHSISPPEPTRRPTPSLPSPEARRDVAASRVMVAVSGAIGGLQRAINFTHRSAGHSASTGSKRSSRPRRAEATYGETSS